MTHNKGMKGNKFTKGALILVICNLVGKVIGAFYRIPLARIIGGVGMGQYQLTFPLYCLILTISTSGVPVAMSKLIAEYNVKKRFNDSKKLLFGAILFLTIISALSTVAVMFGAKIIAKWQGNVNNYICYYGIAPAVLFVGVLSAFRGFFQGNLFMVPSAISGLVEQVVKMIAGIFLAKAFLWKGVEYAVFGALLGVSISEFVAFLFLAIFYIFYSKKNFRKSEGESRSLKVLSKELFALSIPITLGGLVSPLTGLVDSLLVVNLLMVAGFSNQTATMMLGIQSGVVEPLINVPVVIAVSISIALLPSVSGLVSSGSKKQAKLLIEKAFQITMSISLACLVAFTIFGGQILEFLYGASFDLDELSIALKLLFLGGFNIVFLSLVQVTTSVLQGLGMPKYPVKTLIVGCAVKVVLNVCLISIKNINIVGATISCVACYLIVFILNFRKINKIVSIDLKKPLFYVSIQTLCVCVFAFLFNKLFSFLLSGYLPLIFSGIIAVAVFALTYYLFFIRHKASDSALISTH